MVASRCHGRCFASTQQTWLVTICFFVAAFSLCALGHADESESDSRIGIAFDDEQRIATLTIDAPRGRLHWSVLLRGLARLKGFDDEALAGLLPDGSVDLNHVATQLSVLTLNRMMGEGYRLGLVYDEGSIRRVVVRVDERALLESQRRLKRRLRNATVGLFHSAVGKDTPRRGLRLPEDGDLGQNGGSLVLFVHGLDSDAQHRADYVEHLRSEGFAVGTFAYRNDASIAEAGKRFADALSQIAERHPGVKVSLVTWSMGGLVARYALEMPGLDPGNVDRLIMVGPPNHGSQLARFAFALDVVEHVRKLDESGPAARLFAAVEDGLGEAWVDLQPDSAFLHTLNQRERHPEVRYTVLLGTAAPLTRPQLDQLRRSFATAGEENRFVRFLGPKVDGWLADLDEVIRGSGDGAVAVERGRLEGVKDTVALPFDHLTALRGPGEAGVEARLRREIQKRLAADPPRPAE